MATEFLCKTRLKALRPLDEYGEEILSTISEHEILKVTISRPRNAAWHRKFFALLNLLFHNQETYDNFEHFRAAFEIALGHCETFQLKSGEKAYIAKSISFAKLDQSGFEQLWDRAVKLAVTKIIPGLNKEALENELLELIG